MKKGILVLLVIGLVACKQEQKESVGNGEVQRESVEPKKELVVNMNYKTNKEDEFYIMVSNIVKDEFQNKRVQVFEKVSPSTSFENLTAELGENNISDNVRIHFGNKVEKEIEIESITLTYGKNAIAISPAELETYFKFTAYLEQDPETQVLRTKTVNNKHWPSLILKKSAKDILTKE